MRNDVSSECEGAPLLAPVLPALIASASQWMTLCSGLLPASGPRRLARPRTPAFHVGNTGSNPVGDANKITVFWRLESEQG